MPLVADFNEFPYVGRTKYHMKGRGFHVIRSANDLLAAKRAGCRDFFKLIDIEEEYRVFVLNGKVIRCAIKVAEEGADPLIRSHAKGWKLAGRYVSKVHPLVKSAAIGAVAALDLDFGAVDVALTQQGGVCVFEVNTAPGLEGKTLERWVEKFKELIK